MTVPRAYNVDIIIYFTELFNIDHYHIKHAELHTWSLRAQRITQMYRLQSQLITDCYYNYINFWKLKKRL